ncbi:hypothetical protein KJ644_04210 [Candidatus Dependentiae bacterium]|nr:hypothetical protein [Candidatus Dependentiae bacterium]MBU4387647.1 hypothetical protein [Candidatus Dependentiae bacterium]MCG2756349.1 hypothetical protein [Candidatus Dependentiae bacterium]
MFNNQKIILFFSLNLYLITLIATPKNMLIKQKPIFELKSFYTELEKDYFKANPWDFMDTVFVDNLENATTLYEKLPFIIASLPYLATLIAFIYEVNNSGTVSDKAMAILIAGGIGSIITSFFLHKTTKYFISGKEFEHKLNKILNWFMKNYNPNLDLNSNNNIKHFVPKELHSIFDSMFREHLAQGNNFLKSEATISIVCKIIERIVYEIKAEKYRTPTKIKITNSNYLSSTHYS